MSRYRYRLGRSGWLGVGELCWVMLNPSTADDTFDDPTIRRVRRFSEEAGYGSLTVVNLFGLRATNPRELADDESPVGPGNFPAIWQAFGSADAVVFAWGSSLPPASSHLGVIARHQIALVQRCCRLFGRQPLCLGRTAEGHPRHPLFVPASQPLVPYVSAIGAAS